MHIRIDFLILAPTIVRRVRTLADLTAARHGLMLLRITNTPFGSVAMPQRTRRIWKSVAVFSLPLFSLTFNILQTNAIFSCGPIIQATEVEPACASFLSSKPKPTPKVSLLRALYGPWALHLNSLHTQPIHQTSPSSRLRCHGRYESQYRRRLTTQDTAHSSQKFPTQKVSLHK